MSKLTLDKLNEHLFEAIEMLKNSKDPNASECEKMDTQTASEIAKLGAVVINSFKIKAEVIRMLDPRENPSSVKMLLSESGIASRGNENGN